MEPIDPPNLLKRPPRITYKKPYAFARSADSVAPSIHSIRQRSASSEGHEEEVESFPVVTVETEGRFSSWKRFFSSERVLFGTWEGVYTTVLLNIVGIILFLRMGWLVGNTGIGYGILLILVAIIAALITSLSTIGICMRCEIRSGGIFYIVSHVLGIRWGGTVGIIYTLGQAIVSAMYCIGFAEAFSQQILQTTDLNTIRLVAIVSCLCLTFIVLAGVTWVVRIQLLLLFAMLLSILDFVVGAIFKRKWDQFDNNWGPDYLPGENFFTIFGVFFPAATGIMAGTNMSGDLLNPERAIPVGTLAAIGSSTSIYLLFHFVLGFIGPRAVLLSDYDYERDTSLTKYLFMIGLYIGSLSSALSTYAGAPRVLQIIGGQNVIPWLSPLSVGRGPNNEPVRATLVLVFISCIFMMIGELNSIAPLVTMAFLATYGTTNYAYFALATSGQTVVSMNQRELKRQKDLQTGVHDGLVENMVEEDEHVPSPDGADLDYPMGIASQKQHLASSAAYGSDSKLGSTEVEDSILFKLLFKLCNRWVALFGIVWCVSMMFLIDWKYAITTVGVMNIIYTYIAYIHSHDGVRAARFVFSDWLRNVVNTCLPNRWKLKPLRFEHIPMPEPVLPTGPATCS